jgi:hypothetical protein
MRAREGVVVLIAHADRRIEPLGQPCEAGIAPASTTPAPFRITGKRGIRQQRRRLCERAVAAGGALELDHRGQVDVDHLGPEIARHVDLRRGRGRAGLQDHAVQHLGDAGGVAHLFLVGDHVLEQRICSTSWKPPWPMVLLAACGVTSSSGVWFQ